MRTARITAAAALTSAGLLLAGCGGSGGTENPPTSDATSDQPSLASFDPCTALSSGELQGIGVTKPGEPVDQGVGEPGCEYNAGDFNFRLYKAEGNDLSYWERRKSNFDVFEPNKVGAHEGIKGVATGASGNGQCRQIVVAGGGSVSVAVTYRSGNIPSDDATCAKAMEIAQVVEPKLPK